MCLIIDALLKRPMIELAELAGVSILCLASIGGFFCLICKGLSLLHIKKVSLTGVECSNDEKPKKRIFRKYKGA
jgi:hypothetical protein